MPRTAGQSRSGSRAEIADPAATRKPSVSVTVDRAAEQAGARRALIGSGLLLALAVGLANALNAVFQFGSARVLERGRVLAPRGAVRGRPDRRRPAARVPGDDRPLGRIEPRRGRRSGAGIYPARHAAVGAASGRCRCSLSRQCSSRSAAAFGLANPLAIGATAATIAIALVIPVVWGGLQGAGRFRELSGATMLFAGTRLAVGLVIARRRRERRRRSCSGSRSRPP